MNQLTNMTTVTDAEMDVMIYLRGKRFEPLADICGHVEHTRAEIIEALVRLRDRGLVADSAFTSAWSTTTTGELAMEAISR